MKKHLIISLAFLICIIALICGFCFAMNLFSKEQENPDTDINKNTESTDKATEAPTEENTDILDSTYIEGNVHNYLQSRIETKYPDHSIKLKVFDIGVASFYRDLSNMTFREFFQKNEKYLPMYFYAEHSESNTEDMIFFLQVNPMLDEKNVALEDRISEEKIDIVFPCWSIAYDYVKNPETVFGEGVAVENIYCLNLGPRISSCLTYLDIAIYYETDKGDFILFLPAEYEARDPSKPIVVGNGEYNKKFIGYSDTVYLFRPEILKEAWDYMDDFLVEGSISFFSYSAESRLQEIVDLTPYKLVRGQLPD